MSEGPCGGSVAHLGEAAHLHDVALCCAITVVRG